MDVKTEYSVPYEEDLTLANSLSCQSRSTSLSMPCSLYEPFSNGSGRTTPFDDIKEPPPMELDTSFASSNNSPESLERTPPPHAALPSCYADNNMAGLTPMYDLQALPKPLLSRSYSYDYSMSASSTMFPTVLPPLEPKTPDYNYNGQICAPGYLMPNQSTYDIFSASTAPLSQTMTWPSQATQSANNFYNPTSELPYSIHRSSSLLNEPVSRAAQVYGSGSTHQYPHQMQHRTRPIFTRKLRNTTASPESRRGSEPTTGKPTGDGITVIERRGFRCEVRGCSKAYARLEHLKRHIKVTHDQEKEFWTTCMFCPNPKQFSRRDNWRQHLTLHASREHHPRTAYDPRAIEELQRERLRMKKRSVMPGKSANSDMED